MGPIQSILRRHLIMVLRVDAVVGHTACTSLSTRAVFSDPTIHDRFARRDANRSAGRVARDSSSEPVRFSKRAKLCRKSPSRLRRAALRIYTKPFKRASILGPVNLVFDITIPRPAHLQHIQLGLALFAHRKAGQPGRYQRARCGCRGVSAIPTPTSASACREDAWVVSSAVLRAGLRPLNLHTKLPD